MQSLVAAVERLDPLTVSGRVAAVNGLLIEARGGLSRLAGTLIGTSFTGLTTRHSGLISGESS